MHLKYLIVDNSVWKILKTFRKEKAEGEKNPPRQFQKTENLSCNNNDSQDSQTVSFLHLAVSEILLITNNPRKIDLISL